MNALRTNMADASCDSDCGEHHEMSPEVARRVHVLSKLHHERNALASEMRREMLAIERKYSARFLALDADRAKVVNGERDPSAQELADYQGESVSGDAEKGIPGFWLRVLRMHPSIAQTIEQTDAEALNALRDVRAMPLVDNAGFRLEFEFAHNPYFEESVLSKEYRMAEPEADGQGLTGRTDECVYDSVVCTPITWKAGRNLCHRTVTRVQRHRTNNTTRTVKREEPTPSFFHFFTSPHMHAQSEDGDDAPAEEIEALVDMDFAMGEIVREALVPDALNWFTGFALNYADVDYDDENDDDESYDEDEDQDSDGEESDDASDDDNASPQPRTRKSFDAPPQQKPECKQQ